MRIAIVDGQGGGIGKNLVEKIRKSKLSEIEILALGTNSIATSEMLKAGADKGATGTNPIIINAPKVDAIVGPMAIVIPNSVMGEITPEIAFAIGNADVPKILIPLNRCNVYIPCIKDRKMSELLDGVIDELSSLYDNSSSLQKK